MKRIDVIGQRYGRLVVLAEVEPKGKQRRVICQCDCGEQPTVFLTNLNQGRTTSCRRCGYARNHGHTVGKRKNGSQFASKTYKSWESMKQRCSNPKATAWKYYGGKGVKVCERWNDFYNFLEDMKERPEGMTLDRIDSDGDYTPENCKWSTYKEQARNSGRKKKVLPA